MPTMLPFCVVMCSSRLLLLSMRRATRLRQSVQRGSPLLPLSLGYRRHGCSWVLGVTSDAVM